MCKIAYLKIGLIQRKIKMDNYNGWKNWETWNANLYLTNDEVIYNIAKNSTKIEILELLKTLDGIDQIDTRKIDFTAIMEGLSEL